MPRLLAYIMVADSGKAPKIEGDTCTLSECKQRTIVKSAEVGDWIIGIGGEGLNQNRMNPELNPDYYQKLIYAMKVESKNPPKSTYFTHYGEKAIDLDDFRELQDSGRTEYFDDPKLYNRFNQFMEKERGEGRKDMWGEYCSEESREHSCKCK